LVVAQMRVHHSATPIHFFAGFSTAVLQFFEDYCKKLWFLFGCEKMNMEQQINLKFLVWFGKTSTEALKLLQEVYGVIQFQDLRCLSSTRGSKKEETVLKLIPRAGVSQQAEPVKISSLW